MIQYATLAADPISSYASQYGGNRLDVAPLKLIFTADVPDGKFNDSDLQRWVNTILSDNRLPGGSTCLVIPHPPGTTNTDGDATKGIGGYHGKANCPYCYVNVFGNNFTIADKLDSQANDHYALQLSHEIAEMAVDPGADGSNPEVCDPCGPNCGRVWRDFYYAPPIGAYMLTSKEWPASFDYGFMLNAIVKPAHSGDCPAPQSACAYSSAVSSAQQLLFYEPSDGVGENWATIAPNYINLQRHYEGWRTSWSKIIAGLFSGKSPRTPQDILFYDPSSDTGEFYQVDMQGNFTLLGTNTGWRSSWSIIVPGKFSDSPFTDLLFYDAGAATGEFYRTDGQGGISLLSSIPGWRNDWSIIVPGNFTGRKYSDLLFYEASTGTGEFWSTDGHGGISLIKTNTGWRSSWAQIIAGNFSGGKYSDLLFYDPGGSTGEFYRTDGHGGISLLGSNTDWRNDWSLILTGNFFGNKLDDLLFYQRESGIGDFWRTDGHGNVSRIRTYTDWRTSWSIIIKH